ncbi:hypothetical protein H1R20_g1847, partial [Candolleomyces eurysporus]
MLLTHHPVRLDPASFAYFTHYFSECDKLDYSAVKDDTNMLHLTCFNIDNPTVGLINGQLSISSSLLQRGVLDPVVDQTGLQVLLLVGGFAGSEHLGQRVKQQFSKGTRFIARPPDSDTAKLRGAAQYRLAKRGFGFDSYLSEVVS